LICSLTCSAAKRKREEDADRQDKLNKGINKYFSKNTATNAPKPKPVRTADDDAFMASLLGEVDSNIPGKAPSYSKSVKSSDRRKTRVLSPPVQDRAPARRSRNDDLPENPSTDAVASLGAQDDEDAYFVPQYNDDVPMSDPPLPSSPAVKAVERREQAQVKEEPAEEDDLMEVAEVAAHSNVKAQKVNFKGSRPAPKLAQPVYPTPASSSPTRMPIDDIDMANVNRVTEQLNILSSPEKGTVSAGKVSEKDTLEDDGTLRFFWTDYTEVNGSLCLFGKVKNRTTGSYVSCFVKVDNILRKLYFLPREYRRRHGRDTDEEVEMGDVYGEVDELMYKEVCLRTG
jgi:DNA polymerase alpha subunit A